MSSDSHTRVDELFLQARALPAEGRSAFLAEACGNDDALRAEVEALLAADHSRFRLDQPRVPPDGSDEPTLGSARSANGPPRVAPPEQVGPYRILEEIGEGGMGTVYLAEQREPIRRRVALKIIKLGMDTKSVIARFEAERQALAMMDHPNVARILDAGTTAEGRPYFVMEHVQGERITDYCDRQPADHDEQRLLLFTGVCDAVQHAHQKAIIHRDIKPSNILVTVKDGKPISKVIDFGVAKATRAETDRAHRITPSRGS